MDFQPSGCPESGKKCTQSHRACVGPQTDTHPLQSSVPPTPSITVAQAAASATSPDACQGQCSLSCLSPTPKSEFHAEQRAGGAMQPGRASFQSRRVLAPAAISVQLEPQQWRGWPEMSLKGQGPVSLQLPGGQVGPWGFGLCHSERWGNSCSGPLRTPRSLRPWTARRQPHPSPPHARNCGGAASLFLEQFPRGRLCLPLVTEQGHQSPANHTPCCVRGLGQSTPG